METNNFMIWFKSLCNVIVGSDSPNYFALVPGEGKTSVMDTSDRNNNELNGLTGNEALTKNPSTPLPDDIECASIAATVDAKLPNINATSHSGSNDHIPQVPSAQMSVPDTSELPSEECKSGIELANGGLGAQCPMPTADASCCDIMKYKKQLCNDLRSSPSNGELKSGQTIKSSKIITAIIDVIKSRQLFARFDPFTSSKQQNMPISPLVTVCMRNCTITGFSNIEKADSDGIIRYLGSNRFSIDCPIQIVDLRCEAQYCVKLGQKWHKRICLRNKTFTLKLDKCLIYVELKVNTQAKTIRMERFSPISQQNVRCKAQPFSLNSINQMFCKGLQRYFEKYFAANVLKLESHARRYLDRSALLKYDDIIADTALEKLLDCLPTSSINTLETTSQSK